MLNIYSFDHAYSLGASLVLLVCCWVVVSIDRLDLAQADGQPSRRAPTKKQDKGDGKEYGKIVK
jgi:hypothetical protein